MPIKKPTRFNLRFQNEKEPVQIRNLDDLAENMNLDDLYSNFQSGQLEQWLRTRGEGERADGVSQLEKNDEKETLLKLFDVLKLGFSGDDVKESIDNYENQKMMAQLLQARRQKEVEIYENQKKMDQGRTAKDTLLHDDNVFQPSIQSNNCLSGQNFGLKDLFSQNRFEEYAKMKEKLKSLDKFNLPEIRAVVAEMLDNYPDCFVSDYLLFHYEMCARSSWMPKPISPHSEFPRGPVKEKKVDCPLAVLAVWMNVYWRTRYRQAVEHLFNTIRISSDDDDSPKIFPMNRKNGIRSYNEKLMLYSESEFTDLSPWIKKGCIKVKVLKAKKSEWEMLIPEDKLAMILFVGNDVEVSVHNLVTEEDGIPMQLSIVEGLKCRLSESYRYNGTVEHGANRLAYIEY